MKAAQYLLTSLLLFTVVFHTQSVARRNLVNRAASELSIEADRLRDAIESGPLTRPREIQAAFERLRRESSLDIAWIQLRDRTGAVTAHVGERSTGAVVVHTVAIQWPSAASPWKLAAEKTQNHVAIIEIAARLDRLNPGAPARNIRLSIKEENTI